MLAHQEMTLQLVSELQKWASEFRRGRRERSEDDTWCGSPDTAITEEDIDRVNHMVMGD